MRKLLAILVFIVVVLVGCSSQTLYDAISKSEFGKYDKPEILYQNDDVGVVIFLSKDSNGDFYIYRTTYELTKFNRYELDKTEMFTVAVDIGRKSEFVHLDTIGENTDEPINFVWGGIFHYPKAEHVTYKITDGDGTLHENQVEINNKHIFVDLLPEEFEDTYSITFDVIDRDGNVLFSYN
ncbi:hypothetical protein H8S33_06600 [Ornithinibacillus sp. BX22]|uniref:Uncharacterized protein n=2 Tax=Ornithinibacillus TaxID=484508 RepID=A0A923L4W3_9BACI|nr:MULTISPECIES: hypothetical protein [Ornithinibacillus]MBC5636491.1 hypothetical protein [Ornithinibacillus hominis]MBS3680667.1 hypothetical protein [Ornithinibacillus massiliensis]